MHFLANEAPVRGTGVPVSPEAEFGVKKAENGVFRVNFKVFLISEQLGSSVFIYCSLFNATIALPLETVPLTGGCYFLVKVISPFPNELPVMVIE